MIVKAPLQPLLKSDSKKTAEKGRQGMLCCRTTVVPHKNLQKLKMASDGRVKAFEKNDGK